MPKLVPSVGPRKAKLVLIGEAPGAEEERQGEPFVGKTGILTNALLSNVGIKRSEIRIMNVIPERPPHNDITYFFPAPGVPNERGQAYLEAFYAELDTLSPTVVMPLGIHATWAVTGMIAPMQRLRGHVEEGRNGLRVIPTYHPAACLRQYALRYLIQFDLKKVQRHLAMPGWQQPHRRLEIGGPVEQIIGELSQAIEVSGEVAFDFETEHPKESIKRGVLGPRPTMISLAPRTDFSWCIPLTTTEDCISHYSPAEALELVRFIERVMADPNIRKVAQNANFDCGVLAAIFGVRVRNLWFDTMLGHGALYPSLVQGTSKQKDESRVGKKDLEFLTSLYTDAPLHKKGTTSLPVMNALDSALTLEVAHVIDTLLKREPKRHATFQFDMSLLEPCLAMTIKGTRWDGEGHLALQQRLTELTGELYAHVETAAQALFAPPSAEHIAKVLLDFTKPKARYKNVEPFSRAYFEKILKHRASKPEADVARILLSTKEPADLTRALLKCMNLNSDKQVMWLLYDIAGLPRQYRERKTGGKKGKKTLTVDEDAIRVLAREAGKRSQRGRGGDLAKVLMPFQKAQTQLETWAAVRVAPDGRFRCNFNVGGAYTGRLSSSKWFSQGANGQTFTREGTVAEIDIPNVRNLVQADPGYTLVNVDLAQAEDRVVAWLANDHELIRLYNAGVNIHTLRASGGLNVPEVEVTKQLYAAGKLLSHSGNYGGGAEKRRAECEKKAGVLVTLAQIKDFDRWQARTFPGVPVWRRSVRARVDERKHIETVFGRQSRFMDRVDDALYRQAYAFEPQATVVHIANAAMLRVYYEEPRAELLMQGHDSLLMQVRREHLSEVIPRLEAFFCVPMELLGGTLTIPTDVEIGDRWGSLEEAA